MVLHLRVGCFVLSVVHQLKLFRSQANLFTLKQVDAAMIYAKVELFTIPVRLFFTGKFLQHQAKVLSCKIMKLSE